MITFDAKAAAVAVFWLKRLAIKAVSVNSLGFSSNHFLTSGFKAMICSNIEVESFNFKEDEDEDEDDLWRRSRE